MAANNFPNEAVEMLASQVHDPIFFDKLAEWNIHPQSEREKEQLLELGLLLRNAQNQETVKVASDGSQFLNGAIDSLRRALGDRGIDSGPSQQALAVKQAAAQYAQHPDFVKAALEYGNYLASQSNGQ